MDETKKTDDVIEKDDTITISTHQKNGEKQMEVNVKKSGKKAQLLKEAEAKIKDLEAELLRNRADLENFKKRMNQERIIERKYAAMDLVSDLLIPLDQLDKVVNATVDDPKLNNYLIGFKMLNDQIFEQLKNHGITPIKALGEAFDPKFHHAVETESNPDVKDGIITGEIQRGYLFKERILRPAMVKVNEWRNDYGKDK